MRLQYADDPQQHVSGQGGTGLLGRVSRCPQECLN